MANRLISADEMAKSVIDIAHKVIEDTMPNASDEEKQKANSELLDALAESFFMF